MDNPYHSPSSIEDSSPEFSTLRRLVVIAWLYPFALIGSFYATWMCATLVLGHTPRSSLDDPKSIGLLVDVPYVLAGLMLVAFPAAIVFGVGVHLTDSRHGWRKRVLLLATFAVIWLGAIALLRWDPFSINDWYMD
jgi:hypothetical protein